MDKGLELLPKNDTHRRIIHLDMDAFYASVEMRDHPEYRHKALVVARDPREHHGHGVITTANYLARKYGVGSAMPAIRAVKQVPEELLAFVAPNFDKYRQVSDQIHEIMHELTDQIETVSLDEAYLDVTQNKLGNYSVIYLANYMQEQIYRQLHLTSSFGISYNKFLAKIGSDYAKPFGKTLILPDEALDFLANQDISKFPGIGKKTQEILRGMNINTGADLQAQPVSNLVNQFKKAGYYMAMHAHGIDLRPVESQRQRKSIGKERTFDPAIYHQQEAMGILRHFCIEVAKELKKRNLKTTCVVLKIRDLDFQTFTRRKLLKVATQDEIELYQAVLPLFHEVESLLLNGVRLLGVSVTNLANQIYVETDLFITDDY